MAPTPEARASTYGALWDRATITPDKLDAARQVARAIFVNETAYAAVERATGVPWFMVGAIHNRESSLSFRTHLHNGDSLRTRTTHVPAGRPKIGRPPFKWQDSAVDALAMPPHALDKVRDWSVERILYECERYNGWGYLAKGNSPYLWSWTSEYHGGKYVADHLYDPSAWDRQAGCVAVIKALAEIDPRVAERLNTRERKPPPDVLGNAAPKERSARKVGGSAAGVGGLGEAAKSGTTTGTARPDGAPPFLHPAITWSLIGVGLAVAVVATVLIARQRKLIAAKW
jgi:lysozyme family protein